MAWLLTFAAALLVVAMVDAANEDDEGTEATSDEEDARDKLMV